MAHIILFGLSIAVLPKWVLLVDAASSPSSIACANLTSSLGPAKVDSDQLSVAYINSRQDYWNARESAYAPTCIVYPTSAQDVSLAITAIRAADSRFAIKAGGHSPNDMFSAVDSGVLIDLGSMTGKTYDAASTLATYEPGSNWGQLYEYYESFGVTVMGGRLAGVGTGLALGGGLSYLSPQFGMACDSFRELEVVLPNGTIVTASDTTNPDLFLGLKGGGGNAYGVVTTYTVQTRPIGTFYAGNLIYAFDYCYEVLQAIHNFVLYNDDPKAVILPSYEILTTPDLALNLDELAILFLVYDGPDPGDAFINFTSIPHLIDTRSQKTYTEVANMPVPLTAELTRADNAFRSGAHRPSYAHFLDVFESWRAWATANKGAYVHTGFYAYPVAASLVAGSAANGGNAMGQPSMPEGPWYWTAYELATPPLLDQAQYAAVQRSFADMVDSTPSAEGLPLFLNEAAWDQDPLASFSTFAELKEIKARYDPDGYFANMTGGWSFE